MEGDLANVPIFLENINTFISQQDIADNLSN